MDADLILFLFVCPEWRVIKRGVDQEAVELADKQSSEWRVGSFLDLGISK